MKIAVQGPLKYNLHNLMRQAGYVFLGKDEENGEMAFARPAKGYPRFHLFIMMDGENANLNLHLDQKRPIYKGAPAHAGEYGGELVEKEAQRIKNLF